MVALRETHGLDLPRSSDGRPILSQADLDAYDPSPQHSGSRLRYYCPVHGGDHQRSLSVTEDGRFTCHSCGARGTLRDFWTPVIGRKKTKGRVPLSLEARGRLALARKARQDEERAERLAQERPPTAQAFIDTLPSLMAALRDPACPGYQYLARRGLDPRVAADYGAGYAPPNLWPGDRGRKSGRIVFPLADPLTGRIVSALGRLCDDPEDTWTDAQRDLFTKVKQRKLKDCPAGIWPYISLERARAEHRALFELEGPADCLAFLQRAPECAICAGGTAELLTASALIDARGLVLAFDEDDSGRRRAAVIQADLALAGVRVRLPQRGWLYGRKDLGQLAEQSLVSDDASNAYARAIDDVRAAAMTFDGVPAPVVVEQPTAPSRDWLSETEPGVWTVVGPGRDRLIVPTCRVCGSVRWRLWHVAPMNRGKTLYKTQFRCISCFNMESIVAD